MGEGNNSRHENQIRSNKENTNRDKSGNENLHKQIGTTDSSITRDGRDNFSH